MWTCALTRATVPRREGFDSLKPIGHDQQLIPYVQLNDSALEGSGGVLPGEGVVPLYDYLAALPDDIDIRVEAQIPPNNAYTGMEWAKMSAERIRKYLARYRAAKAPARSA